MKIAIIGFGRMGSWLAKEFKPQHQVVVFDNAITERSTDFTWLEKSEDLADFKPDLLVNAVSLQNTLAAFDEVQGYLPSNCMLCDIASVKTGFKEYYEKSGRRFVSVHPMFGPTFATLDALREENAIVIKESDKEGRELFVDLFARLGVRVFDFSFIEHDQMMAYSLTTPFVASLVFAACVDKGAVPGTTFARHKKIARGLLSEDDHLLAEVLFNQYSIGQLEKITARLEFLKHVIRARDMGEAKKFFDKLRLNIES